MFLPGEEVRLKFIRHSGRTHSPRADPPAGNGSSSGTPAACEISSGDGSRPSSWSSFFAVVRSFDSTSIMWTGIRIVRAWSAIARVIAWRIHQVAYVENLKPRRYSYLSTARIRPVLPSWMRSRNDRPRLRYFLAIDTTSRRFEAERLRLATSYSSRSFSSMATRVRSDRGLSSVVSIRSRSSFRMSARSSVDSRPSRISRRSSRIRSMRADMPRSSFTSGCTRRVRRLSSSTSTSDLARFRRKRMRASLASSGLVRVLISRRKSARPDSMRWSSVRRLWGIRAWICSFVSRSVSDTLIVRSKGRVPWCTLRSVSTVVWRE